MADPLRVDGGPVARLYKNHAAVRLHNGAPVGTPAFWNGKEFLTTGPRWNDQGWYGLAEDSKGAVSIPYSSKGSHAWYSSSVPSLAVILPVPRRHVFPESESIRNVCLAARPEVNS